jgi:hypothetical protein
MGIIRRKAGLGVALRGVWHARAVVTPGNLALIRFTLRLSVDPQVIGEWGAATFEAIERSVRARVKDRRTANADGQGNQIGSSGAIEEFLVRIRPITATARHSPAVPPPLDWPGLAPQHFSVRSD